MLAEKNLQESLKTNRLRSKSSSWYQVSVAMEASLNSASPEDLYHSCAAKTGFIGDKIAWQPVWHYGQHIPTPGANEDPIPVVGRVYDV